MRRTRMAAAGLLLTLVFCGTSSSQSGRESLAPLRELAGDWLVTDSEDQPTGLRARYEALAGGSVVMARFRVGTLEETVTLPQGDGSLVTGTHASARSGSAARRVDDPHGSGLDRGHPIRAGRQTALADLAAEVSRARASLETLQEAWIDTEHNHYGQISVSEIRIVEQVKD